MRIRISSPDLNLQLERRAGWQVAGQAWKHLDQYKVEALIEHFVRAEALKCERDMQGRDPDVVLEFFAAADQAEIFKIWFGCPVFAEVPAIDGVVELDPALTRLIPDSITDLLDRALINPEAQRIRRLSLRWGRRSVEVRRKGEGFVCGANPLRPGRVGRLLVNLRRLEGEESWRGPAPAFAAMLALLAVSQFGWNRLTPDGRFVLDGVNNPVWSFMDIAAINPRTETPTALFPAPGTTESALVYGADSTTVVITDAT